MPWAPADATEHTKQADTDRKREVWADVANSARARCIDKGGDADECDASAIRQANEAVAGIGEQEPGGPETCVCPDCGYETDKERGVPCRSMECPECGAMLVAGEEVTMEQRIEYRTDSTDSVGVTMTEVTKTVDGEQFPASDFLVVEDPDKPSTWHLQVKKHGTPDHGLMGGAKAALTSPGGHRGNRYEGPGKTKAIRDLKALYNSEDLEWTTSESAVEQARDLIEQALALLSNLQEAAPSGNGSEPLSEVSVGRVIAIEEAEVKTGRIVPLTLDIAVIEPGPGNAQDGHYYPAEVLRRDAGVFKGAKQFATDHRIEEKSVGTWVATIKACPVGFTPSGAPIARSVIHKEWFARDVLALKEAGLLDKMECSILGTGKAKKAEVDGVEYNVVEAITAADAVDYVSRAGAGGRALALAESDAAPPQTEATVDQEHDEQEVVQEAKTVTLREDEDAEQPQAETPQEPIEEPEAAEDEGLSADRVDELLKEAGLGEDAARLLTRPYESEQAVADAIAEFRQIIKRATGSGQPFAQGTTEPAQRTELTEADRQRRYNEIKVRYGGKPIPVGR